MNYEWDETKRQSNLRKHGLDFQDVERFDWESALLFPDEFQDGEQRHRELGWLDGRLVYLVYTQRGPHTRLISLRVATRQERQRYDQYT